MYAASWTNVSDARYKHDIQDLKFGLNFIMKLKPRRYIYNNSTDNKITMRFVAQEVQSVMNTFGMNNYNLVKPFEKDYLGLNTTEIETLRNEIENIKKYLVNIGAMGSAK